MIPVLLMLFLLAQGLPPESLTYWERGELERFHRRCEASGGRVLAFQHEPRPGMEMLVCERGVPGAEQWERQIRWGPTPGLLEQEKSSGGFQ